MDHEKLSKALESACRPLAETKISTGAGRLWLEVSQPKDVLKVARLLRSGEKEFSWDWLEHLSAVHQPSGDLVFSAFLERRTPMGEERAPALVLRWRVHCGGSEERVGTPSLREAWSEAPRFEYEIGALFGVTFRNEAGVVVETGAEFLPKGWVGFPLRKNYLPPMEFLDIPHSRSAGQTSPDEFAVVPDSVLPEPILDGPGGW